MKRYMGIVIFMIYTVVSIAIASYSIRSHDKLAPLSSEGRTQTIVDTPQIASEPVQSETLPSQPSEEVAIEYSALNADKIIEQTNSYRAIKNLPPLQKNASLMASACEKAQHMITKNYWAHTSPDGKTPWFFIRKAGYRYTRSGENLAYGYTTNRSVVNGWIKSPGHEKILSGNYTETGVCVIANQIYRGHKTTLIVGHYARP